MNFMEKQIHMVKVGKAQRVRWVGHMGIMVKLIILKMIMARTAGEKGGEDGLGEDGEEKWKGINTLRGSPE